MGPHKHYEPYGTVEMMEKTSVKQGTNGDITVSRHEQDAGTNILIYAGTSPDAIDHSTPVAQTSASRVTISGLDSSKRYYFEIVAQDGSCKKAAQRILPFYGAPNFRDLGGYQTIHGRSIKWGKLYRSGDLSELTDSDLAYLANLELKTIFDLRSPKEIQNQQNRLPATNPPETVNIFLYDEKADPYFIRQQILTGNLNGLDSENFLIEFNKSMVFEFTSEISDFFKSLCDPERYPALLHCTIGKDRTGFMAAAVLLALGVSKDMVHYDYQLTNRYTSRLFETIQPLFQTGAEILRLFLQAQHEYLQAAFDTIDEEYGSFDRYLREALAVSEKDQRQLR